MLNQDEINKLYREHEKELVKIKLDFMQLAQLLKGGGMFFSLGPVLADLSMRKSDLEGQTNVMLTDTLFNEFLRIDRERGEAAAAKAKQEETPAP